MPVFKFSKNPIYIPKVQDSNICGWGLKLPVVFINSFTLAWRPSIISVKEIADMFIVDPVTDRAFSNRSGKENFKKLKYPEIEPEQLYSDVEARKSLIEQAIKNQLDAGANIVIAPYLFAKDTDDTKFSVNLTLLAETIKFVKEKGIDKPLFAMICMGNSILTHPTILNHIIDRYNDDFAEYIDGFIISIDDFSGRTTTDVAQLLGYANLVYRLAEYKSVIVKRIDDFGEILSAIGAVAFSSGLAISETYSLDESEGGGGALKRIYVPEIFDYLNDEEAKKVGYSCHLDSLPTGTHPETHAVKIRHFLLSKLDRINKMQSLNQMQRIDFMLSEVAKGRKLADEWTRKYAIPQKFLHAGRWEEVLSRAKYWKPSKQNDMELAKLLEELEK